MAEYAIVTKAPTTLRVLGNKLYQKYAGSQENPPGVEGHDRDCAFRWVGTEDFGHISGQVLFSVLGIDIKHAERETTDFLIELGVADQQRLEQAVKEVEEELS